MQRKVLNAAVTAAIAAMAANANAGVAPSTVTAANTAAVYISGSSATNNQLIGFARKACVSGSLTHIKTSDSNNFALLCQPDAAMGAYSKANVIIVKNSTGGSGNGVGPVAQGDTSFSFLDVFNTTWQASCGAATAKAAVTEYIDPTNPASGTQIALPAYEERSCGTTATTHAPDMGISDEEPAILKKADLTMAATEAQVAALTADPLNIVTFGVPVTKVLRDALQTQQIANGALPGSCVAGDESVDCMPSLSKSSVTSMLTGNLVGWSELGLAPADDQVYVARRPNSSGTQTAARIFFLNDPCAGGMLQFAEGNNGEGDKAATACSATSYAAGANVYVGSGSGNVETCLANHNAKGRYAIGVLGIENPAVGSATAAGIRHIKVDGVSPDALNVSNGRYGFWVEATLNYVSSHVAGSSDLTAMQTALTTAFNDPAVVRSVNKGFNTTALISTSATPYTAGVVAPAASGVNPDITTGTLQDKLKAVYLNPTSHMTRGGNSCQPGYTYWAVGTSGNQP